MLLELARREKIAGIKPDEDLDLFMKVLFEFELALLFRYVSLSFLYLYVISFSPVVGSWRPGDRSCGGVYPEGILSMLWLFFFKINI